MQNGTAGSGKYIPDPEETINGRFERKASVVGFVKEAIYTLHSTLHNNNEHSYDYRYISTYYTVDIIIEIDEDIVEDRVLTNEE